MINKSFFICKECRKRSIKEGMCWYDLEKSLQIGIFHAPDVLENSFSLKLIAYETKLESYDIYFASMILKENLLIVLTLFWHLFRSYR